MQKFERSVGLPCDRELAFRYHEQPQALARLIPPWQSITVVSDDRSIREGGRKLLQMKALGLRFNWEAIHEGYLYPSEFVDRQRSGPLRYWLHRHRFEAEARDRSRLLDSIQFELPFHRISEPFLAKSVKRELERVFRYRHDVLLKDLELNQWLQATPGKRIAVTGSSGLVGKSVCSLLNCLGHEVIRIRRTQDEATYKRSKSLDSNPDRWGKVVGWDPLKGLDDPRQLEGLDACIHLAGKNIASRRWNPKFKEDLFRSRVEATELLTTELSRLNQPPKVFVSASAIGLYGDCGNETVAENHQRGEGFLADLASAWEGASQPLTKVGTKVCHARLAMVLSSKEGPLRKMLNLFNWGLGGTIGNGKQWWSWVGLEDAASAFIWMAIGSSASGAYNVVSPQPVTNKEFTKVLARVVRRPAFFPAPAGMLKIGLGEMVDELLLSSCKAVPGKLLKIDFPFRFSSLEECLKDTLGR